MVCTGINDVSPEFFVMNESDGAHFGLNMMMTLGLATIVWGRSDSKGALLIWRLRSMIPMSVVSRLCFLLLC